MNEPTDISEEAQPERFGANKRYFRTSRILQLLRKRRGRLFVAVVLWVLLFAGIAMIQRWFVREQLLETTKQELGTWATEVTKEVGFTDKWDLEGYRRASISVPGWCVVAKDGLIVDTELFTPRLFGRVELPEDSVYSAPHTVVSTVGEKWRLFGRRVAGGSVVVGISSPENVRDADAKLASNAARFGSTLAEAESTSSRKIDLDVDYAVVSSAGELKAAEGGIPLKIDARALPSAPDHLVPFTGGGRQYLLYFRPILDSGGREVGVVIVPKDMTLESRALEVQDRFNRWVVGITMVVALVIALWLLWLIVPEVFGQTKKVTLEEALKSGESRTIEFKSTFQWDVHQNKRNEELQLNVLKAIAGFLNAKGGTLFIGVAEEGITSSIRGLAEDLQEMGGSKDKLQLTLRHLITERIGSAYSYLITDDLKEHGERCWWEVTVAESPEPAFVRWKPRGQAHEQKIFYVREGPKTTDLDNESTWRYIKNKWG